jgi:hypothetical protein
VGAVSKANWSKRFHRWIATEITQLAGNMPMTTKPVLARLLQSWTTALHPPPLSPNLAAMRLIASIPPIKIAMADDDALMVRLHTRLTNAKRAGQDRRADIGRSPQRQPSAAPTAQQIAHAVTPSGGHASGKVRAAALYAHCCHHRRHLHR